MCVVASNTTVSFKTLQWQFLACLTELQYTKILIHHTYTRQYKGLLKFTLGIYHNKNYLVVDL